VLIFTLLSTTNLLINIDHGIIPAATFEIEKSLSIGNGQLGLLGSLVYAGIVTIGLFGGKIFLLYDTKKIIIASYIGMLITLLGFTFKYPSKWPYFLYRYLTGISQVISIVNYLSTFKGFYAHLLPCLG